jgi:formylglycine-generating enzyme required for sulfatase activity
MTASCQMSARSALVIAVVCGCGRLDFDPMLGRATTSSCPPCASHQTASAVAIAAGSACYCIDATEVTNARYLEFIGSGAPPSARPECAWKTTYIPTSWPPSDNELLWPVATVDWCDADALCTWAGERMCGAIGGGAFSLDGSDDDEWYVACSDNGQLAYPYGSAYVAGVCWDSQPITATVAAVASHPGCQGGFSGIFDMSGNVNEWVDACMTTTGSGDMCVDSGGGKYYFPSDGLSCTSIEFRTRNERHSDLGFRCCAP